MTRSGCTTFPLGYVPPLASAPTAARAARATPKDPMPQSLLVTVYVLFGMTCTVGLTFTLPVVANVLLGVFSMVFTEIFGAKARGMLSGTLSPEEGGEDPKIVIGYPPGYKKPAPRVGPVEVEPDSVPTGMLTRLAVAVTVVIVVLVIGALQLFKHEVAAEMTAKGYPSGTEVVPRVMNK